MSTEKLFSFRNPWFTGSIAIVGLTFAVSALIGFVWVPYKQNGETIQGLWDAICRAAGTPGEASSAGEDKRHVVKSSDVIVKAGMVATDDLSIGRGATLAQRCTMCHGVRGMSGADTPNLAGQYPEATYKQLRDFKDGYRKSEIMAPHVRALSNQDMLDIAAYYASLPREHPPPTLVEQLRAPAIVQIGAPMRNIPPCISCHGGSDYKSASPQLEGASASYLREQLHAFVNGTRKNDIHGQMRNIARQMTPEEIETAARYYARK